jgi:hypothetical protein
MYLSEKGVPTIQCEKCGTWISEGFDCATCHPEKYPPMHKTTRGKVILFCAFLTLLLVIFGVYKSSERNTKNLITSDTNALQGEISGQENLINY